VSYPQASRPGGGEKSNMAIWTWLVLIAVQGKVVVYALQ